MPIDLNLVKTIVVVMMENRSFDHLLGYLSLPPFNRVNVDGIQGSPEWKDKVASKYKENRYRPFLLTNPYKLIDADPPHKRNEIATQMGGCKNGMYPMDGFVTNYANAKGAPAITSRSRPPVMGYFGSDQVPVTHFFAQQYAICDHWFCSIPTGTQPNRLMAMSGYSLIDDEKVILPRHDLVYDWLTRNNVRWRVYHEGMPFFSLMPAWIGDILRQKHFRPFKELFNDIESEEPDTLPQVIFIEPSYTNAPHIGVSRDDHAPSAVKGGQQFLHEAYRCVSKLEDVWRGIVMIVTYDEHGGFFDHVSPPALRTDPPPESCYTEGFESLGVRVPAFVISPFVTRGHVCNIRLDHTSVLKFIGQKFGPGGKYSDLVNQREVGSVWDVLNEPRPREAVTIDTLVSYLAKETDAAGFTPETPPNTTDQHAYHQALKEMRHQSSDKPPEKWLSELFQNFLRPDK